MPCSANHIHSFVGLYSHLRHTDFATIARSLTELIKKDAPFLWGSQQVDTFFTLAIFLTSLRYLAKFWLQLKPELAQVVLAQWQHGQDCIMAYASHLLSVLERSWPNDRMREHECLTHEYAIAKATFI